MEQARWMALAASCTAPFFIAGPMVGTTIATRTMMIDTTTIISMAVKPARAGVGDGRRSLDTLASTVAAPAAQVVDGLGGGIVLVGVLVGAGAADDAVLAVEAGGPHAEGLGAEHPRGEGDAQRALPRVDHLAALVDEGRLDGGLGHGDEAAVLGLQHVEGEVHVVGRRRAVLVGIGLGRRAVAVAGGGVPERGVLARHVAVDGEPLPVGTVG